jgi:hypothetical protein
LIDSEVFVGNPEAEVSKWEIPKFAVEHVGNRRLILRRAPYENRLAFVEIDFEAGHLLKAQQREHELSNVSFHCFEGALKCCLHIASA